MIGRAFRWLLEKLPKIMLDWMADGLKKRSENFATAIGAAVIIGLLSIRVRLATIFWVGVQENLPCFTYERVLTLRTRFFARSKNDARRLLPNHSSKINKIIGYSVKLLADPG